MEVGHFCVYRCRYRAAFERRRERGQDQEWTWKAGRSQDTYLLDSRRVFVIPENRVRSFCQFFRPRCKVIGLVQAVFYVEPNVLPTFITRYDLYERKFKFVCFH